MARLFRWTAIVPLTLLLVLIATAWLLYADRLVEKSVEDYGADLVGAQVDVATADLRLREGRVELSGLAVTNPDSPMRNLFEASEIVADIRMQPLLTRKVIVQEVAVRGLRFGTERSTSGALDPPRPESGRLMREIETWRNRLAIPPLDLSALDKVVNIEGIALDSLESVRLVRATTQLADSLRTDWGTRLAALNPAPTIDSARSVLERLQTANPLRLGVAGTAQLVNSGRRTLNSVTQLRTGLAQLDSSVQFGMQSVNERINQLGAARQRDYRYALGLLKLPSFEAPDISLAIFGEAAAARLTSILYFLRRAEDVLPPGLQPRRFLGPKRARRPGTTVTFPEAGEYPRFLLEQADFDFSLEGRGASAGTYAARLAGVTTAPAVYGRPTVVSVTKAGGSGSALDVGIEAVLDHTGQVIRDSVRARIDGVGLPVLRLPRLGAQLALGVGANELTLRRVGSELSGRLAWRSDSVTWSLLTEGDGGQGSGLEGRIRDLLWRTISSIRTADVEIELTGSVTRPVLGIRSNIGREVTRSIRAELGREIQRVERDVRAEVDRRVAERVTEVRQRVEALETEVAQRVGIDREQAATLRAELEQALRRLGGGVIP